LDFSSVNGWVWKYDLPNTRFKVILQRRMTLIFCGSCAPPLQAIHRKKVFPYNDFVENRRRLMNKRILPALALFLILSACAAPAPSASPGTQEPSAESPPSPTIVPSVTPTSPPAYRKITPSESLDELHIVTAIPVGDVWLEGLALSPDGKILASTGTENQLAIWDMETGTLLKTIPGSTMMISALAFSPDGSFLVSGAGDGTVTLWSVPDFEQVQTFTDHFAYINDIRYAPDGNAILVGFDDRKVLLWDIATGTTIFSYQGIPAWIDSALFSPDGSLVAAASGANTNNLLLWDTKSGELRQQISAPNGTRIIFSPDGKSLIAGTKQGILVFDIETGEETARMETNNDWVLSLAFSPDGDILATGFGTGGIVLWDWEQKTELRALPEEAPAENLIFTPDGRWLICSGGSGMIDIWGFDAP
jgi:tricorn protease-like protein